MLAAARPSKNQQLVPGRNQTDSSRPHQPVPMYVLSFPLSYDIYVSSRRWNDWTLDMLETSFWHFMLNFLGRPKHLEQAGGLWIRSQLLSADSEESHHILSRQVD